MASFTLAAPFSTKMNADLENARRSVKYHSSVWGDHFLSYTDDLDITLKALASEEEEVLEQREEVRRMFGDDCFVQKLHLIDAIQRLGVAYHFEKEIYESLLHIYQDSTLICNNSNLRTVALRFRVLRQHGYRVSSDVFKQFKDDKGKFERSFISDTQGLLSLYEAAHYAIHGEEILEEALEFCTKHLQSIALHANNALLSTQIEDALKFPIHKSLIIIQAKKFMHIYENEESHNKILLKFAKMNFNLWQKMAQIELSDITKWWKDLDAETKWPFARDRIAECYLWILGFYYEPEYSFSRKTTTKITAMLTVLDDIYDVQGTLDELQMFTDAIQRWDIKASEQLPSYMRHYYEALLYIFAEMELVSGHASFSYRMDYAKEEMKKNVRAYLEEAKWLYSNHIPTMEEYMEVTLVTTGHMMFTTFFVGMGNIVSDEEFEWITSEPLLIGAYSIIARLKDDMAGYGFEQKFSAVSCYQKETGCSKNEAFIEFDKRVWCAWKDINQECLRPTQASMPILMIILNAARFIHLLYKDEDIYTFSKNQLKDVIKSLLTEPLSIHISI